MVTRIFSIAIVIWLVHSQAQTVKAVCSTVSAGTSCPPNFTYTCSYRAANGNSSIACCSDSTSCTQFRTNLIQNTSNAPQPVTKGKSGALKVDPSAGCSDGINTALGCIPYKTDGFSSALLSFLIGIVGLVAIVVMLVATVMIMTGGGNHEQIKKGKELFTGGITGLFFIIFSVTILRIIAGDIIKLPGF